MATIEISIHAPSRERQSAMTIGCQRQSDFNPRSLAGATCQDGAGRRTAVHFNPRSLAGATSIKTNYFSIHLNQAFFAN